MSTIRAHFDSLTADHPKLKDSLQHASLRLLEDGSLQCQFDNAFIAQFSSDIDQAADALLALFNDSYQKEFPEAPLVTLSKGEFYTYYFPAALIQKLADAQKFDPSELVLTEPAKHFLNFINADTVRVLKEGTQLEEIARRFSAATEDIASLYEVLIDENVLKEIDKFHADPFDAPRILSEIRQRKATLTSNRETIDSHFKNAQVLYPRYRPRNNKVIEIPKEESSNERLAIQSFLAASELELVKINKVIRSWNKIEGQWRQFISVRPSKEMSVDFVRGLETFHQDNENSNTESGKLEKEFHKTLSLFSPPLPVTRSAATRDNRRGPGFDLFRHSLGMSPQPKAHVEMQAARVSCAALPLKNSKIKLQDCVRDITGFLHARFGSFGSDIEKNFHITALLFVHLYVNVSKQDQYTYVLRKRVEKIFSTAFISLLENAGPFKNTQTFIEHVAAINRASQELPFTISIFNVLLWRDNNSQTKVAFPIPLKGFGVWTDEIDEPISQVEVTGAGPITGISARRGVTGTDRIQAQAPLAAIPVKTAQGFQSLQTVLDDPASFLTNCLTEQQSRLQFTNSLLLPSEKEPNATITTEVQVSVFPSSGEDVDFIRFVKWRLIYPNRECPNLYVIELLITQEGISVLLRKAGEKRPIGCIKNGELYPVAVTPKKQNIHYDTPEEADEAKRLYEEFVASGEKDFLTYLKNKNIRLPNHIIQIINEIDSTVDFKQWQQPSDMLVSVMIPVDHELKRLDAPLFMVLNPCMVMRMNADYKMYCDALGPIVDAYFQLRGMAHLFKFSKIDRLKTLLTGEDSRGHLGLPPVFAAPDVSTKPTGFRSMSEDQIHATLNTYLELMPAFIEAKQLKRDLTVQLLQVADSNDAVIAQDSYDVLKQTEERFLVSTLLSNHSDYSPSQLLATIKPGQKVNSLRVEALRLFYNKLKQGKDFSWLVAEAEALHSFCIQPEMQTLFEDLERSSNFANLIMCRTVRDIILHAHSSEDKESIVRATKEALDTYATEEESFDGPPVPYFATSLEETSEPVSKDAGTQSLTTLEKVIEEWRVDLLWVGLEADEAPFSQFFASFVKNIASATFANWSELIRQTIENKESTGAILPQVIQILGEGFLEMVEYKLKPPYQLSDLDQIMNKTGRGLRPEYAGIAKIKGETPSSKVQGALPDVPSLQMPAEASLPDVTTASGLKDVPQTLVVEASTPMTTKKDINQALSQLQQIMIRPDEFKDALKKHSEHLGISLKSLADQRIQTHSGSTRLFFKAIGGHHWGVANYLICDLKVDIHFSDEENCSIYEVLFEKVLRYEDAKTLLTYVMSQRSLIGFEPLKTYLSKCYFNLQDNAQVASLFMRRLTERVPGLSSTTSGNTIKSISHALELKDSKKEESQLEGWTVTGALSNFILRSTQVWALINSDPNKYKERASRAEVDEFLERFSYVILEWMRAFSLYQQIESVSSLYESNLKAFDHFKEALVKRVVEEIQGLESQQNLLIPSGWSEHYVSVVFHRDEKDKFHILVVNTGEDFDFKGPDSIKRDGRTEARSRITPCYFGPYTVEDMDVIRQYVGNVISAALLVSPHQKKEAQSKIYSLPATLSQYSQDDLPACVRWMPLQITGNCVNALAQTLRGYLNKEEQALVTTMMLRLGVNPALQSLALSLDTDEEEAMRASDIKPGVGSLQTTLDELEMVVDEHATFAGAPAEAHWTLEGLDELPDGIKAAYLLFEALISGQHLSTLSSNLETVVPSVLHLTLKVLQANSTKDERIGVLENIIKALEDPALAIVLHQSGEKAFQSVVDQYPEALRRPMRAGLITLANLVREAGWSLTTTKIRLGGLVAYGADIIDSIQHDDSVMSLISALAEKGNAPVDLILLLNRQHWVERVQAMILAHHSSLEVRFSSYVRDLMMGWSPSQDSSIRFNPLHTPRHLITAVMEFITRLHSIQKQFSLDDLLRTVVSHLLDREADWPLAATEKPDELLATLHTLLPEGCEIQSQLKQRCVRLGPATAEETSLHRALKTLESSSVPLPIEALRIRLENIARNYPNVGSLQDSIQALHWFLHQVGLPKSFVPKNHCAVFLASHFEFSGYVALTGSPLEGGFIDFLEIERLCLIKLYIDWQRHIGIEMPEGMRENFAAHLLTLLYGVETLLKAFKEPEAYTLELCLEKIHELTRGDFIVLPIAHGFIHASRTSNTGDIQLHVFTSGQGEVAYSFFSDYALKNYLTRLLHSTDTIEIKGVTFLTEKVDTPDRSFLSAGKHQPGHRLIRMLRAKLVATSDVKTMVEWFDVAVVSKLLEFTNTETFIEKLHYSFPSASQRVILRDEFVRLKQQLAEMKASMHSRDSAIILMGQLQQFILSFQQQERQNLLKQFDEGAVCFDLGDDEAYSFAYSFLSSGVCSDEKEVKKIALKLQEAIVGQILFGVFKYAIISQKIEAANMVSTISNFFRSIANNCSEVAALLASPTPRMPRDFAHVLGFNEDTVAFALLPAFINQFIIGKVHESLAQVILKPLGDIQEMYGALLESLLADQTYLGQLHTRPARELLMEFLQRKQFCYKLPSHIISHLLNQLGGQDSFVALELIYACRNHAPCIDSAELGKTLALCASPSHALPDIPMVEGARREVEGRALAQQRLWRYLNSKSEVDDRSSVTIISLGMIVPPLLKAEVTIDLQLLCTDTSQTRVGVIFVPSTGELSSLPVREVAANQRASLCTLVDKLTEKTPETAPNYYILFKTEAGLYMIELYTEVLSDTSRFEEVKQRLYTRVNVSREPVPDDVHADMEMSVPSP